MPPQSLGQPTFVPSTPVRIGRFKASRIIVQESWALLSRDKEILWLPVLSGITFLASLFIIFAIYYYGIAGGS